MTGTNKYDDDRESPPEHIETIIHDDANVPEPMEAKLRAIVSEEVAKARQASLPLFLVRINEAISQAVKDEFEKIHVEILGHLPVVRPEANVSEIQVKESHFSYKEFSTCSSLVICKGEEPLCLFRWL